MRVIQGTNLGDLPDQFAGCVAGRTLILDGDGPAYVAAATVKRLDTAVRRYQQEVLKFMFLAGAQDCRVHLTARNSDKHGRFRVIASKPYQGQRDSGKKPPLLEPLREALADNSNWLEEFSVMLHRDVEADDAMMQDAYRLGESGVIRSDDKDLRMTPFPYYDIATATVRASEPEGYVSLKVTDGGSVKLVGQGPIFFWGQMLTGDGADNIRGIEKYAGKLCGPAGAFAVLEDVKTQAEAANLVLDGYRAINQNAVAEGWLLWLTRWHKDNVIEYMRGLALSPENRDFVEDCVLRNWVKPKEENERYDD